MLNIEKIVEKMQSVTNLEGLYVEDESGNIIEQGDVYIRGGNINNYVLVYTISEMLKNGELSLEYTNSVTEKNKKYLEKLLKEN